MHILGNIALFLGRNERPAQTQVSMVMTTGTSMKDVDEFTAFWRNKVDRVRIYDEHSTNGKFGGLLRKRKGKRTPCAKLFNSTVISWDGAMRRCNHDWDGEPLGSVVDHTIWDVWHGEQCRELRQQHLEGNITDETCRGCDSWYLEEDEAGTGILIRRRAGK